MFEIAEKTKEMITKLTAIQPALAGYGLVEESDAIKEMKVDLVMMLSNITPDHPCMQRVLAALREDTVSSVFALFELISELPDEMTDAQLNVAILAAESFVSRGRDYLDSKRKAFELTGGDYGRA